MNYANPTGALFPIFQNTPALTGLARIAAEGEHTEDGHLVEFRTMKARSILNRSTSRRQLSLDLSINPYRGCEFGCRYCYARYTHGFLAPGSSHVAMGAPRDPGPDFNDPNTFERVIFMKQNAAWLLEQELRRVDPSLEIALGTATDPYQPIERRALVTRSILEVFARHHGLRLGIVTKSKLIERDIDLLRTIARNNVLVVHITITTADTELARKLEPRAPRPDLRFAAVRRLSDAGIRTGVLCSPLLPGITDSEAAIDGMARRSAATGADFFAAQPLFLKPCSRETYLGFVREHFPELVQDYERRFGTAEFAAPPYRRQLALAVARACRRYGLRQRSSDALLTRKPERRMSFDRRTNGVELPTRKGPAPVVSAAPQRLLFA